VCGFHQVVFRFEGDSEGVSVDQLKETMAKHDCGVSVGYSGRSAAANPLFSEVRAYGRDCPIRCPHYKGNVRYGVGVTPVADRTVPRTVIMPNRAWDPPGMEAYAEKARKALKELC
jgi:hypothetical protein